MVLCVSPPVIGFPVPNTPVSVSVNLPGVMGALAADRETLIFSAAISETDLDPRVQVVRKYGSLHVSDTVPVNPPKGARVRVKLAVVARLILAFSGVIEIEKSATARTFARLVELGLKLLSPE